MQATTYGHSPKPAKNGHRKLGFILVGIVLALCAVVVALSLTRSSEPSTTLVTFTAEPGTTVLEQLQQHADVTLGNGVSEQFVQGINGVENGDNDKYWYYYINGKPATRPEADFTPKGGEFIEWKFEALK